MSRILELNSGFGCNGEVGLLLLLFWVSVAKQRGSGAGATATKDEHEDNVVAATLVSGLFKCLARYFDVGAKQRRAPKFHPRQIQSTCKPDNIHPNAGEATYQNKL